MASYYVESLSPSVVDRTVQCKQCFTYVSCMEQYLSRAECTSKGTVAGYFDDAWNVILGERQVWFTVTAPHTVREVNCLRCGGYLGWKIVHAHDDSERWKNGSYVLERDFIVMEALDEEKAVSVRLQGSPQFKLKVVEDLRKRRREVKKPIRPLPSPPVSI